MKLTLANTYLQAATVISIVALTWVSASGWTDMSKRMEQVEISAGKANVAIAELANSMAELAATTAELQLRINQAFMDPWTGTDMKFWVLALIAQNPGIKVPQAERVVPQRPPAMDTSLTSERK